MPLVGSNGQQNHDDESQAILDDVSLNSFTADPTDIGAFGTSVLSWRVTGPSGDFHVELNQQRVETSGEQVVQPASITTYRLTAIAGQSSKLLGTVQVAADTSSCQINAIVNASATVLQPVFANITGDLSFRNGSPPVVTFSPGQIRLQLQLTKQISHFPDPAVDIDASFGLTVHDVGPESIAAPPRVLELTDEQINVDISEPWYAWLIPGAALFLPIALDGGKTDAHNKMHELLQGIIELLNVHLTPPDGYRMRSVRVDVDSNGAGIIETTQCLSAIFQSSPAIS